MQTIVMNIREFFADKLVKDMADIISKTFIGCFIT